MKHYQFQLTYTVEVVIDAEDFDSAEAQMATYIQNNPGPSVPDVKVLATTEDEE